VSAAASAVVSLIELSSPVSIRAVQGERVRCRWELTNNGAAAVHVSFHVRSGQAPIAALECHAGIVRRGRYRGDVVVVVAGGATASVSAELDANVPGKHAIRVAAVTRDETLQHVDMLVVEPA
jgi:uncharacterized protein (DUF849 family)